MTPHNTADLSTKLFYGFGAVANGAKSNGFNYLLLFFYSQVVGLPAQWVSLGIFIALLFDAVSDPLVGYISDNFRSRWGRRHPFMYFSALPVSLAFYLLWSPPDLEPDGLFIYFVVVAILIRTLITFYEIPSTALVAELTEDYDQRTKFMSFRYFFGWWGGLTMAVLAYLVFLPEDKGGLEYVEGWSNYGLAASIMIFVSIMVSALGTHRHIPYLKQAPVREHFSVMDGAKELKETLSNESFLVLFVAALFISVAAGISTSLSIYFTRHFWEFTSEQIGYLQFPYFLSAFVALFLAPAISKAIGKKYAAIGITTIAVIASPMPFILRMLGWFPDNGSDALFPTLMVFFAVEVTLVIISSILIAAMIADVVEDSEVSTGRRSEGTFFAANSFAQKAVGGLGVIVAGQLLAYVQFPTQAGLGEVPTNTLYDLAAVYIPALWGFYLIAIVTMSFYRISRDKHAENLSRIAAKEVAAATDR
ncbi:MAG: MFS transporter [Pseudomonadales bacterium]|jgi:Na+/melibiose symporter-like transporter